MTEPLLSLRGLRTEFPTDDGVVVAVDGVDLDVLPGECLGVVGESGSGKSVTFLSLLGMVRAPGRVVADSVLFEGRDLRSLPPSELRALRGKAIALTFQDAQTALNPALRVEEQIAEVFRAHPDDGSLGRAAVRDRSIEMLRLVGIPAPEKRITDFPHQFSGGMRQRIMIAIALACRPRLLIADEPTSALDVTIQAQILDLIEKIRRDLGTSVVLITHDLGVVAERCDRVAVMYAGRLVEEAPGADLFGAARHPYTQGLLAALPTLTGPRRRLAAIPGTVPEPGSMPAGCRFAPRCPVAESRCVTVPPSSRIVGFRHAAACHRRLEPGASAWNQPQAAE